MGNKTRLSRRILNIEGSQTIELAKKQIELRAQGHQIISLLAGEPDFDVDQDIRKATNDALERGETRYGAVAGHIDLRKAISDKIYRERGQRYSPQEICVSNGAKQALFNAFQAILDPGDEILVPIPYWTTFPEAIKLAGGIPVEVPTKMGALHFEDIESRLTDKTKAILINSPNNPTGEVYSQTLIDQIIDLSIERDLLLLCDEAYEAFVYDFESFPSALGVEKARPRTITFQTFSKTYGMTGYRLGHVIAPADIIAGIEKLQGHLTGNVNSFAQFGGVHALSESDEVRNARTSLFRKRRDLAFELCSELLPCKRPGGAFYIFADIRGKLRAGQSCKDFAIEFMEREHVAVVHGGAFGAPGFLRISFASNESDIKEGLSRLKRFLS